MSDEVHLHDTTDAQTWASEWCRIAREIEAADDGRTVIDEGWMVSWFANAIEVGRNAGSRTVLTGFPPEVRKAIHRNLWRGYGLDTALAAAWKVMTGELSDE